MTQPGNNDRSTVTETLLRLPDPGVVDIARLAAAGGISPDLGIHTMSTIEAAFEAGVEEAIECLEGLSRSAPTADAEFARLQLGLLMTSAPAGSPPWCEGVRLLSQSMESQYADVVGSAAWAAAQLLEAAGEAGLVGEARAFEDLAVELGDPDALLGASARLFGEGRWASARECCERLLSPPMGDGPPAGTYRHNVAHALLSGCLLWEQPETLRTWYFGAHAGLGVGNEIDGGTSSLFENASYAFRGLFNVECGDASISSRHFPVCPTRCNVDQDQDTCTNCDRDLSTIVSIMAGQGDGVYPVFALHDGRDDRPFEGAITLFQGVEEGLASQGSTASLSAVLWRSAPLIVGSIRSDGVLYFADARKSCDDANLAVDVHVERGEYLVVAWVAPPDPVSLAMNDDNTMRPLALGAVTGRFARRLTEALPRVSTQQFDELLRAMWRKPGLAVSAHAFDVTDGVSDSNVSFDLEEETARAVSWMIQRAESGGEMAAQALSGTVQSLATDVLSHLEHRGTRTLSLSWWEFPEDGDADVFVLEVLAAIDPSASESDVDRLAHHPSPWVRRLLARRSDLSQPAARLLCSDPDEYVRVLLAENPSVSGGVLGDLSADVSTGVQCRVAMNANTPPDVLEEFEREGRFVPLLNQRKK